MFLLLAWIVKLMVLLIAWELWVIVMIYYALGWGCYAIVQRARRQRFAPLKLLPRPWH
jgi:hypothetical protein